MGKYPEHIENSVTKVGRKWIVRIAHHLFSPSLNAEFTSKADALAAAELAFEAYRVGQAAKAKELRDCLNVSGEIAVAMRPEDYYD